MLLKIIQLINAQLTTLKIILNVSIKAYTIACMPKNNQLNDNCCCFVSLGKFETIDPFHYGCLALSCSSITIL